MELRVEVTPLIVINEDSKLPGLNLFSWGWFDEGMVKSESECVPC